ncbi:anthranilate synthase component I [Oceanobacillus zhaokaii]|uniref:Anthranilate synthase component 1 n=1 Tax=Oceanobacillus zhaokaii TaxID=2052660 RepID=A0A345PD53_9BACI|nr:anthranilate synthase component I [Oceanobacillus zhaokaii]AXI07933.1 anthranilate synthase component I [Oceanobacillus zhaokaii]
MSINGNHEYSFKSIKQHAGKLTPIEIYRQLPGKKKFLLESTFQHQKKGKFSFIGGNPYQEIIGNGHRTTVINHEKETKETIQQHGLNYVKEHLPKIELDFPFPFYGGAVGYIGYDSIRLHENIGDTLPDDLDMPDIHLMVYKDIIVFDHADESLCLIVLHHGLDADNILAERINLLQKALSRPTEQTTAHQEATINFKAEITEEKFLENVSIAKKHLKQGDVFQVVLSQRLSAEMNGDPLLFYQKLREANPSPYMFYIDFESYLLLGASPESLVQTTGREIVTNPIAGTRARGKSETEDEALATELLQDEKEIAEHRMLVDLSRNDLGRVCEVGSITIPTYMTIERYQHVMHIVSEVKGVLRQDLSSIDALIACLPAGTVSGAPKIRAMQLINELEEKKRGVYGGGIGFINFNHDINIALAIRSLVIKENQAILQAGAGIVYDSVAEMEYQETLNKAKSIMEVNDYDPAGR